MIVPKLIPEESKPLLDASLIESEHENKGSWTITCNNCGETAWFNQWIRNKKTGRCALLSEEYFPETGQIAKRHDCMRNGTKTGKWINKYDGSSPSELKKKWCPFCDHYYDLSHWCIFTGKSYEIRPQLMCIKEVQMCNHSEYYDPLTNGWVRK